jgi:hypothetical protein
VEEIIVFRTSLLSRHRGRVATLAASGVVVAIISVAAPISAHAAGADCAYVDNANHATADSVSDPFLAVSLGDTVTITCTGLPASTGLAIAQANGGAGLNVANAASFTNAGNPAVVDLSQSSDASGDVTATEVITAFTASNGAACPATQAQANAGLSCSLAVATLSQVNEGAVELVYSGAVTPAAASLSLTGTPGPGRTISLVGSHFWGSPIGGSPGLVPAPTILLDATPLSNALTISSATWPNAGTNSLTQGGDLGGALSVTLPNNITPGPHAITVLEGNATPYAGNGPGNTVEAQAVFSIAAASVTSTTASGNTGTVVNLTGSGWVPNASVTVAFTNGTPAPSTGTATVDASGNLTGSITVGANDQVESPNPIVVTDAADSVTASYAFNVTAIAALVQNIVQPVAPGALSDSQVGGNPTTVTLSTVTLNGLDQHGTGNIKEVTVIDARGTFHGWTLTGTLSSNFANTTPQGLPADNVIPASNLVITPSILAVTGIQSEVTAGAPGSHENTTTGVTLASAAAGGGGGTFTVDAGLDLLVPANVAAGSYDAALDIVLA